MPLLLATTNPGKIREMTALLRRFEYTEPVLTMADLGLAGFEVDETEDTLFGNALKKAKLVRAELATRPQAGTVPIIVVADDSGIYVDALDGKPGVRSHRYAADHGRPATRTASTTLLLEQLTEREDRLDDRELLPRTASYRCALVAVDDDDREAFVATGRLEGTIAHAPAGDAPSGFGYDAVFIPKGCESPLATFSIEERVARGLSHRLGPVQALVESLKPAR